MKTSLMSIMTCFAFLSPIFAQTNLVVTNMNELKGILIEYQRSGNKEPVALTPEMEAQLVKDGVLPKTAAASKVLPESLVSFNFREASLEEVTQFYSELSKKTVKIAAGVSAKVTANSVGQISIGDALRLLEETLAKEGLVIRTIDGDTLLVTRGANRDNP